MTGYLAIDIGGTFTDLVYFDESRGVVLEKAPTVPSDPGEGVAAVLRKADVQLGHVERFFHGTTLGINTLLEGTGAPTGLITTAGFRDVLEIGRMNWPMYRLHWQKPDPLVPRRLRIGVGERITADGRVLTELSRDEVLAAGALFQSLGVRSVAVSLINAYAHPQHELEIEAILIEAHPNLVITLSHRLTREFREYERTCTTVVDAVIKPRLGRYLDALETSLAEGGLRHGMLVTRSDGGVMDVSASKQASVRTLLSGPASGVMGAAALARELLVPNAIAADMGGTSFDAALIVDGEPTIASYARVQGFPILMPVVDLVTIGAGGGSLARIDASGALDVGPDSAGAVPGPMAYERGGSEPTVTDAALVAGLIDPESFLGGDVDVDRQAAADGIADKIAAPLGLSIEAAAAGIMDLAEAKMASTLEDITVGRGLDPREFTLIAYGGGGPLVANALAARLEMSSVVIPPLPSAFSAWGMLTLDDVRDFAVTRIASLADLDGGTLETTFEQIEAEATALLDENRVPDERRRLTRSLDMRYENQEHSLSVRLPDGTTDFNLLRSGFDAAHQSMYGYVLSDPVEVVTYRVRAVAMLERPPRAEAAVSAVYAPQSKGARQVIRRDGGAAGYWPLYDRSQLRPGALIHGPAIVEEQTATIPVLSGYQAAIDAAGNLLLTPRSK